MGLFLDWLCGGPDKGDDRIREEELSTAYDIGFFGGGQPAPAPAELCAWWDRDKPEKDDGASGVFRW